MKLKFNFARGLAVSLMAACAVAPTWVHAAQHACKGQVDQVGVDRNGGVVASFTFNKSPLTGTMLWEHVCNVNESVYGIAPASCKSILAVLLTARSTQQSVELWFNAGDGTCSLQGWSSLNAKGWYFGPSISP
jgi:hypothetical protein